MWEKQVASPKVSDLMGWAQKGNERKAGFDPAKCRKCVDIDWKRRLADAALRT
jgi:hypothetical protein